MENKIDFNQLIGLRSPKEQMAYLDGIIVGLKMAKISCSMSYLKTEPNIIEELMKIIDRDIVTYSELSSREEIK